MDHIKGKDGKVDWAKKQRFENHNRPSWVVGALQNC